MKIAVVGECMLEMSQQSAGDDRQFQLGFAGDTYNVAVYLRRYAADVVDDVEYVSAIGCDPYSQQMCQAWDQQQIKHNMVRTLEARMPGLYTIHLEPNGERQFFYYRSQAAVRDLFQGKEGQHLANALLEFDGIFFSAITLAVLHQESRQIFIDLIQRAADKGMPIYFDTNYRPRLWDSQAKAQAVIASVLPYVSIGLPSFTDEQALMGDDSPQDTIKRWLDAGVKEVVLKLGESGYMLATSMNDIKTYSVEAVAQVDTTAAGDSFDGAYLAYRLRGESLQEAAAKAAKVAASVVQHRGAIIDPSLLPCA